MFSQFSNLINAVENHLVQPQPRRTASHTINGSQESIPERERPQRTSSAASSHNAASSPTSTSTSQLAESALMNLRKSLATRSHARPGTPQGSDRNSDRQSTGSPQPDKKSMAKSNLEDRLRASFAIGEASVSATPDAVSHAPSPKPINEELHSDSQVVGKDISPASTPLPESPQQEPSLSVDSVEPLSLPESTIPVVEPLHEQPPEPSPQTEGVTTNSDSGIHGVCTGVNVPLPEPSKSEEEELSEQLNQTPAHTRLENVLPDSAVHEGADPIQVPTSVQDREELLHLRNMMDAVNKALLEYTPVESIANVDALRDFLQVSKNQLETTENENKRLLVKLSNYDERIEELRDTHRLESRSQSEMVDSLRRQLEEMSGKLASTSTQIQKYESERGQQLKELEQMRGEAQKLKDVAKEEEEKRVKAISLLKTVRQKLVKAEKERDDLGKEISGLKERENISVEKERSERTKLEKELIAVRAEKEKDVAGIKSHFDRELGLVKERLDKEYLARIGQIELEAAATKVSHQKEVTSLHTQIQSLENSVRSLNAERGDLFDQIQLRQAELESSQTHLESLQSATSELRFQLREVNERAALLAEELSEARQLQESQSPRNYPSIEDELRARESIESKYKAQISELTDKITTIENERVETEAVLTRTLQQKVQEIDALKRQVDLTALTKGKSEDEITKLKRESSELAQQVTALKSRIFTLESYEEQFREQEALVRTLREDAAVQQQQHQSELNTVREHETQLRTLNKTLRDELRKVQSSAALLERQRNPGVGYWSTVTRQEANDRRQSISSQSDQAPSQSPRSGSPAPTKSDEEVNLEYLRNVILQFLEHKEMRPQLVRVLSIILQFTPQETRRLIAKV